MHPATVSELPSINRVVHLEDRRMATRERGELATEGLSAFTLLNAVRTAYGLHDVDAFLVLNAIAGVALSLAVIAGALKLRRHKDAASSGINLVGVFGGLATVVEGLHRLHRANFTFGRPHFALGVFTIFAGIMTTAMGLLMERLEHRRALSITDDGVRMRLNRFRRFDVKWAEVTGLRIDDKKAELLRATGSARTVPLARLVNRDEVRDVLVEAARSRGVNVEMVPRLLARPA
jgi:hypothetical protein